jgi:ACS family hexuronate transporter-like MFS transporter
LTAEKKIPGFRWTVCAMVFYAMTVNYLDRSVFSLLVPFFENELRLSPTDLALLNVAFSLSYGLTMAFVGMAVDRVGIKRGLGACFFLWNIASIAHWFVGGIGSFALVRGLLGIGESGMYPSAVKTATEWFPQRERATANGIFNAGANMGAFLAPLVGVAIATTFGWRVCFVLTGIVGLLWVPFWKWLYSPPTENPRVTEAELAHIHSDPQEPAEKLTFAQLFAIPSIYGLAVAKAISDAPWWFYLTWMPKFLSDQFKVSPAFMALAIPIIYVVADVGSVLGGVVSSRLISRGIDVGRARKLTMLGAALAVTPVAVVGHLVDDPTVAGIPSVYLAVAITAIAAGAHQGWSANLFTLISDTVPKHGIALAVGTINGFSMIGVSAFQFFVGRVVQNTGSYVMPFVLAGTLYLIALLALQILVPRIAPADTSRRANLGLVGVAVALILAGLFYLQFVLNKPPYASVDDYLAKRGGEIKASSPAVEGPTAKVGWMRARWFAWKPESKPLKLELVKIDDQGRPYVEGKGAKAKGYDGPPENAIAIPQG